MICPISFVVLRAVLLPGCLAVNVSRFDAEMCFEHLVRALRHAMRDAGTYGLQCQVCYLRNVSTPGVEPGLSRPRRDVLTTRRCGPWFVHGVGCACDPRGSRNSAFALSFLGLIGCAGGSVTEWLR